MLMMSKPTPCSVHVTIISRPSESVLTETSEKSSFFESPIRTPPCVRHAMRIIDFKKFELRIGNVFQFLG